jgi:hypothetical protein
MTAPAAFHFAAQQPARRRLHEFQLGDSGVAKSLDLTKTRHRCGNDFRERPERGDQGFGEGFYVAPGLSAEQHRLEKLVIRQRVRSGLAKALAQAGPMAVIMRRALGQPAVALALFPHGRSKAHPSRRCTPARGLVAPR